MTEQIVNFERMEYALTLFGNSDENIRMLEQGYGVSVVFRGTDIKVSGDAEKVMTCTRCIEGLLKMVESGEELSAQNIRYMMSLVEEGREQEAETLGKDVICITAKGKPLKPKTLGQQKYVEAIRKNTITMGIGPAGTGKTYLAVAMAVKAFRAQEVNRIVLTRPAVEAGEKLGFLPGDLQNKVDPYLRPLYDALFDMLGAENFQKYQERGNIEVAPLAYMRAEHHPGADENVPDPSGVQFQGHYYRRCDPDRPAGREAFRAGRGEQDPAGYSRYRHLPL